MSRIIQFDIVTSRIRCRKRGLRQITLAQISSRQSLRHYISDIVLARFLPIQADVLLYLLEQDGGILQLVIVKVIRFVYLLSQRTLRSQRTLELEPRWRRLALEFDC